MQHHSALQAMRHLVENLLGDDVKENAGIRRSGIRLAIQH